MELLDALLMLLSLTNCSVQARAYDCDQDFARTSSWVVKSGVVSPLIWVIGIVTPLIPPLVTTHEPPSITKLQGPVLGRLSSVLL